MFHSPYDNNRPADLGSLFEEIYRLAEGMRKASNNAVARRGGEENNPMRNEYIAGLAMILHDRIQHYIITQAQSLQVEEAEQLTIIKAAAIRRLIDKCSSSVSGLGSEADYLISEVFRAGMQRILAM